MKFFYTLFSLDASERGQCGKGVNKDIKTELYKLKN